ncbi:amidohydrolase [Abyssisolibacter fermentans]|uniref:amidohydrolase n=1 Tax=Abyssisolibacter fermentans TaxID=1766203 RepID=UPI0008320EE2|nr:amidohydrolase [Abyssisolibacter fermentans]
MHNLIQKKVDKIKEEIIIDRRDFHKYPEIGWTEFRTASLVARRLEELGFQVLVGKEVMNSDKRMGLIDKEILKEHYIRAKKQGADTYYLEKVKYGFTGVVGILKCGDGPVIGLRFDIDALEVLESKDTEHFPKKEGFRSLNEGIMHACAHDGHIAIGIGIAKILSEMKQFFNGTIKLIFQPAEEGVRGAKSMAVSGILDDLDFILSSHIGMVKDGSNKIYSNVQELLATSKFDAHFTGISTHAGASPEKGKNVMLAVATAILNLNSIPRHSKGQTRINVGKLTAGSGRNVIPSDAVMMVETRGSTSELNNYMKEHAIRIIKSSADMYDLKLSIKEMGGAESAVSDEYLINKLKDAVNKINNVEVDDTNINFGGSEDFTYMMKRVQNNGGKAIYFIIGSDIKADHHNGKFDFIEDDLITAVKVYSMLIAELLHKK